MNAAVLIASRELRDRSRLFLIAAAMAVIPFAAALAVRQNRQLAIAYVACFLAAAYTGALAVALGVSVIGRDLTEKRLSFFFSKPISAASIWIGKAMAAILTLAGAFLIIVLPAYFLANDGWTENWSPGGSAITIYTVIMSVVLFFGSHAASTMLRSRSALVAVDFALLAATLIAVFSMTRPILMGGGLDVVLRMLLVLGGVMMLILIVAPVWQLARGRIDPRRNHASFSTVLWSSVAVVVLIGAGYAWWVISAPLSGIHPYSVEQSPSGRWIAVSGNPPNRGSYVATFLVDTTSGRRERVATPWGASQIASDGRSMVWLESDELLPRKGVFRVHTRALEPGSKQRATMLTINNPNFRLSNDGSRLAVINGNKLEVYEVETGRLLSAASGISSVRWSKLFFAGPNVVRILQGYRAGTQRFRIVEFDVTRKKLSTTADWSAQRQRVVNSYFSANVTHDGSRIFIREEGTIHDARTGAVLMTLPVQPSSPFFSSMLRDGSVIVTRDAKLYQIDAKGTVVRELPIPVAHAGVTGQVGASKILLSRGGAEHKAWRLILVDLTTGKVDAELSGYVTALGWNDPTMPQFTVDASIVAMNEKRELVLWDLKSGAKRALS